MRLATVAVIAVVLLCSAVPADCESAQPRSFFIGGGVGAGGTKVMTVDEPSQPSSPIEMKEELTPIGSLRLGWQLNAGLSVGLDQLFAVWTMDRDRSGVHAVHVATVTVYPLAWDPENDFRGFYARAGAGIGWGHASAAGRSSTKSGFGFMGAAGYEWMFGREVTFAVELVGGGMTASHVPGDNDPNGFVGMEFTVLRYCGR
jgi:hypothetical protein